MDPLSAISVDLAEIDGQISDVFRALSNGFQKLEKIKDSSRQSRQLEELTEKMRECKRLIKEFDREVKEEESKNTADTNRMLNEKKQSMIKELNSYVALKKQYASKLDNNRADLFDGPNNEGHGEENAMMASSMSNQQLMDTGNRMMDETDQAIERSKKVVEDTVNVGADTAAALKAQTEQMSRIVNELDSIHFSIKKASKLVKEIGRQVATDRCIMALLFIIVLGVIAVIIVKVASSFDLEFYYVSLCCLSHWTFILLYFHLLVNPDNKDIRDIPGLGPPAARRLLWDPK
ncbi:hypothetical protein AQUCO_01400626v1 [Aquilegia coerulea]|uniref:t-SNARE coiled-coil homology domain-containing protein n=1 Tax=Aquilegia coerulea TaxID=218851 RepID=A0A2G5DXC0_AQUCA|nr:hypothetical protein AQUCO_01400626v1 [Aquilegia coerulea]